MSDVADDRTVEPPVPATAPPSSDAAAVRSAGSDLSPLIRDELQRLRASDLLRARRAIRHVDATHVERDDGRRLVNFASNDYLGLSHHPDVITAVRSAAGTEGVGSGASALISGYTRHHAEAERRLALWKQTEAAVLLGSGYVANLAAVQAIASLAGMGRGVRFLLDKLVHASIVDAVRGTGLPYRVFPHNGLDKLRRLLIETPAGEPQVVITESIFSMDGDAADLRGLARLKAERPFFLLLDEAHGSGVYGERGAGLAAELGVGPAVDATIVTLSKALGCYGGAVCGSRDFCDLVVNRGRAYVYSTSLPACIAAGAIAALDVLEREPQRQARLRALSSRVRGAIGAAGEKSSPIVPILLGTERAALDAAASLQDEGIWVLAVRPPTVPRGGSRLRVTLSSEHTDEDVDHLIDAVMRIKKNA